MKLMVDTNEYLKRLLRLADGMLAALKNSDLAMAAELYDERERYMSKHQPDMNAAEKGLVDVLLQRDREVVAVAEGQRKKMIDSGAQLRGVRDYQSKLPKDFTGGDWGSG